MADKISIAEIARRLDVDSTTVRRLIAKEAESLHIEIYRGKGDKVFLTADDANKLIASYEARRGKVSDKSDANVQYDRFGHFYLIQLIPEVLPNRVKIGFADNVEKRLTEHQTSAPTAKLLKAWPCKRSWDYAAMDSITRVDCKLVLNEVYEGNIDAFIKRGDEFFSIMPSPDTDKELSEHSPLYEPDSDRNLS
jgi:hypothetical protein